MNMNLQTLVHRALMAHPGSTARDIYKLLPRYPRPMIREALKDDTQFEGTRKEGEVFKRYVVNSLIAPEEPVAAELPHEPGVQGHDLQRQGHRVAAGAGRGARHLGAVEPGVREAGMTVKTTDGGAAFPSPGVVLEDGRHQGGYAGMTLRDWFAGMALQGRLADSEADMKRAERAIDAYACADAMLKARAP